MKRTVKFPPGMLPPEDEPRKQPVYAAFADGSGEPGGFCWEPRCKVFEPCCIIISPT